MGRRSDPHTMEPSTTTPGDYVWRNSIGQGWGIPGAAAEWFRADERARVERKIAEWLAEWPEDNIDPRLGFTADAGRRLADAILRGEYKEGK